MFSIEVRDVVGLISLAKRAPMTLVEANWLDELVGKVEEITRSQQTESNGSEPSSLETEE